MTPLKKILFVFVGLLLILTILISVGILNFQYKKSEISSASNANWSHGSTSMKIGDVKEVKSEFKAIDLSLVVLMDKDTLYKEINKLSPIVLVIDSYEVEPLWMPLYKSAGFSAAGSVKLDRKGKTKAGSDMKSSFKFNLLGQLAVNGSVVLKGFYSHKEATKLVQDLIVENFVSKAKEHFATFSPEYLQNFAIIPSVEVTSNGQNFNTSSNL